MPAQPIAIFVILIEVIFAIIIGDWLIDLIKGKR